MSRTFLLMICLLMPSLAGAEWTHHSIISGIDGPMHAYPIDMDDDGDWDVSVVAYRSDEVGWVEQTPDGWVPHTVDANLNGGRGTWVGDLNGDGAYEIVAAGFNDGLLVVYWNGGDNLSWTRENLAPLEGCKFVNGADMDNDGDLDILAAGFVADELWVYRNEGNGTFTPHFVDSFDGPYCLNTADFNLDGRLDLLSSSYWEGHVAIWHQLQGGEWDRFTVTEALGNSRFALPVDFDQDGYMDVVAASTELNKLMLYRNDPGGENTARVLAEQFNGARYVDAGDVDQDGDIDIFATALWSGEVAWFEQTDDDTVMTKHIIAPFYYHPKCVRAIDMNDDGLLDALVVGYDENEVAWFEQPNNDVTHPRRPELPKQSLTIYPSPFNGFATIELMLTRPAATTLSVHDVLGRQVALVHRGDLMAGLNSFQFHPQSLASGMYFIRVNQGDVQTVRSVVLQK